MRRGRKRRGKKGEEEGQEGGGEITYTIGNSMM